VHNHDNDHKWAHYKHPAIQENHVYMEFYNVRFFSANTDIKT